MPTITPPGPKVRVQSIQKRDGKTNPYVVRWTVNRRAFSRSFRGRSVAQDFWSRLLLSNRDGVRFDSTTGLPVNFSDDRNKLTIAAQAYSFFRDYYDDWAPRTRRNHAQAFGVVLPLMVTKSRRGSHPTGLNLDIENWLAGNANMPKWLKDHSLPLASLTTDVCLEIEREIKNIKVLDRRASRGGTRVEKPIASSDVSRHVRSIRAVLNDAFKKNLINEHPWPSGSATRRFKKDRAKPSQMVRVDKLPSVDTVHEFIAAMENHMPNSLGYKVLAYLIFYMGLRPSEALGLTVENLTLPTEGWGEALVDLSVTDAGKKWTGEGEELGPPKTGVARTVPVPRPLVKILNDWIGERNEGFVVPTRNGTPVAISNLDRAFRAASEKIDVDIQPYDLRHTCATIMLRSGVSIGETARRLGHTPEILLRTYAGVLADDEESANRLLDNVFA